MSSSLTAIAIVIVNSHSQLNIVFRISNAYTQCGQITNLTEQVKNTLCKRPFITPIHNFQL